MGSARSRRAGRGAALALVVLSFAFRLPPLLNAPGTNSDAAVVGLQARHLAHGELSLFLWGSHYQTSVDSFVAALFSLFVPPSADAYALMLSTLVGHVVLTLAVFVTLRRRLGDGRAFALCLALVFTTSPVHTYVLYPPRQAALTLVFVSVALLDGASAAARRGASHARYAMGAAAALVAVFADPYALVFLPELAIFALLAAGDAGALTPSDLRARGRLARPRVVALLVGAVVGAVPFVVLQGSANASAGPRGMSLDLVGRNARVLAHDALPWLLGAKIYRGSTVLDYALWDSPFPYWAIGTFGALACVALFVASAVVTVAQRGDLDWETRRVGIFGISVVPLTLAGFLGSVMVFDAFAARYLVAIALVFPLAMAPLAKRVARSTLALLLAPYLVATALGGWVGYGPYVNGALPVRLAAGSGAPEAALREALVARGLDYAIADYWTAYRLTFLFHEGPVVVPLNANEDRYRPYRDAFVQAPRFAYVFDPTRSREDPSVALASLRASCAVDDDLTVAGVRVVVLHRVTERGSR